MSATDPEKSEARERAEARRQKILGSRSNRLAKLTNTARGEEASALYDNGAPLAAHGRMSNRNADFITETTSTSLLPPTSATSLRNNDDMPLGHWPQGGPDFMNEAFRQALGGSGGLGGNSSGASRPHPSDPIMAMMQSMASAAGAEQPAAGVHQGDPLPASRSLLSRILPIVHLLSILGLLIYMIAVREPIAWAEKGVVWPLSSNEDGWERWRLLVGRAGTEMSVQPMPVFYVFLTLQVALHSLQFILDRNVLPASGLISTVLPYLPPTLRLALISGMKYIAIVQQFLDDLALMIFVLGVVIWLAQFAR